MSQISRCVKNVFSALSMKSYLNLSVVSRRAHIQPKKEETAKEQKPDFASQYCLHLVQTNDHESFLCTLLLDDEKERRDAFALRAFNVEIAKSNINVTEDNIAKMRLRFWHDSIDKCYSKSDSYVSDHPVLRELKNIIKNHNLTKMYFKRLIKARDRPANQQFVTLQEMENYSQEAFSSLLQLLVECKGIRNINVDHVVSHLGKAHGLTTLLRAIPYKGRNDALNIPQNILIKNGVSHERILRHNPDDKGVEDCIYEVAATAHQHLELARKDAEKVPHQARKIFLPAIAIDRYLERLRKANFRLSDPNCLRRDSMLPLSLYWNGWRGKY